MQKKLAKRAELKSHNVWIKCNMTSRVDSISHFLLKKTKDICHHKWDLVVVAYVLSLDVKDLRGLECCS